MCGRFVRYSDPEAIQEAFAVSVIKAALPASYNIAPTQEVLAIVQNERGTRGAVPLRWGLIPSWAKDDSIASKLINARAETVHEKPSFKDSFHKRRCLIVANGFYEWAKGQKQPVYIQFDDQPLFAFAGLYSFWQNPQGERVATCTILTTEANPSISGIHHRMPVVLPPAHHSLWLDKDIAEPELLQSVLKPYAPDHTRFYPVSEAVNKVSYNQPDCLNAVQEES